MMLTRSIATVTLCLLGFLPNLRTVQSRSTNGQSLEAADHLFGNEAARRCLHSCAVPVGSDNRMEINNALKSPGRRTCFEKCLAGLAGNKRDTMEFSYKQRSIQKNQFLTSLSTRKKRKKRDTSGLFNDICPQAANATNEFANVTSKELKQSENSNSWYVNISWAPFDESLVNFTGYAFVYYHQRFNDHIFRYIKRQKNETYVLYDGPIPTGNGPFSVKFVVIALPCRTKAIYSLKEKIPSMNTTAGLGTSTPSTTGTSSPSTTGPSISSPLTTGLGISNPSTTALVKANPKAQKTAYISVAVGAFAIIVVIACVLRYKYFRKERLSYSAVADFRYDAFIIFNNKDQSWVDGTLLPVLEVEHGLKCCVHYRDFEPGKLFVDNMTDSVQNSRNTIAVVSENFFTSEFCKYELDQAIYKQVKEGCNGAIVIKIDGVSKDKLPDALKNKSFVDYSNSVERQTWHLKLIKVLKSTRNN